MAIIKLEDGRSELYQWDTGRKVVIDDESIKRVHYQNRFYGRTIDVDVSGGFAIIPDQLLQSFAPLVVFAWAGSDEDGYTKIEKTFKVNKRNKPSDYVFTPTDQKTLDGLQKQIGDLANLKTAAKENLVVAINEAAASGGGGADWSQNDPGGGGYVANRPGGYMTDPVITDVDTFTITSAEGEDGVYVAMVAVESSVVTLSDYAIGDGVIVDFGGQSYSLTWQSAEGMPACGATVTGEAPDWSAAPFCIIAAFEKDRLQGYYVYLQNAVTSPIQVQIKKAKQTPVKIPTKYLESDVYIVKVTSKSNEQRPGIDGSDVSYDVTVSATYDDIVAAINAGKMPILLGGTTLSDDPVLHLVNHYTDDVGGSTPSLTFGGAYFHQQNLLYGTCVYIDSAGEATCRVYDGDFVRRFEAFEEASSRSVGKVLVGKKYSDYKYMWAAGDAVLCDEQTLTDAQKKQARDNIDATSSDFVINATVASDNTCTTDKTFAQIQEAVQSGKRAVVKAKLDGSDLILPQVGKFIGYYAFSTVFCYDASIAKQYTILLGQQDNGVIICRVVTYNSDDNLPQVNMAADPTEDMEIATKQYVDDHASGGTGMGITDAAVGQIAKITAVDKSGIPTAWGPVDMPAGVPSVTAADNGKFLRVVNGAWAAAEISSANGVSF